MCADSRSGFEVAAFVEDGRRQQRAPLARFAALAGMAARPHTPSHLGVRRAPFDSQRLVWLTRLADRLEAIARRQ